MTYPGAGDLDEGREGEEPYEAEEQLTLADEDERLPWLESDDDSEEEGVDTARIVLVAVLGLVIIAALLLAGWWLTREVSDGDIVADGSTIEAPDEPYKERPEDPGGREVAGTGDVSFEVGEGQSRRSRLAEQQEPPQPVTGDDRSESVAVGDSESAPAEPSGVGVQVGAYSTRAAAERGWGVLTSRFEALSGMRHRIVQATVDGATVYRLQAVAGDREAADATCRAMRAAGGECQVKG